jgi:uncharacterized lipoprotein NlpE involved in copper resistance
MKIVLLLLVCFTLLGCNRQRGYHHSGEQFNSLDRKAIERVRNMVLGKPEVLNSIAQEYIDEESPRLEPCDYEVNKIVRTDLNEVDGKYPEEIQVICTTSSKNSPNLQFEWVFDIHLERISEFKSASSRMKLIWISKVVFLGECLHHAR